MRRGLCRGAQLAQDQADACGVRMRPVMVDLTYRGVGRLWHRRHLSQFVHCVRQWAKRRGFGLSYVWRFEFGAERGRPHYHVMLWVPEGAFLPRPDQAGWWPHGATRTAAARSPVGYMAKYASKPMVWSPHVGWTCGARWWGVGGLEPISRDQLRYCLAPQWVREKYDAICGDWGGVLRRLVSGWWRIGGWDFRSPWEYLGSSELGEPVVQYRGWGVYDFEVAPG